ncbi:MAG: formate dehydrogenase subunit gamma [Proteobacteria bacterium]|nr:formate dehydrogenase subunit gamma [Pseudomonadota bacterium]
MSEAANPQSDFTQSVKRIVQAHAAQPGALLPILHAVQEAFGYVSSEALPIIALGLNLSRAEVHGVVSFYHHFRSSPPGRLTVQICRAESCQAMGSRTLQAHAKRSLGVDFNETTANGAVTLLPVYCLGNCACSPAIRVGDKVFGNVDADSFDAIVAELSADAVEVRKMSRGDTHG